ncbi:acetate--CoA ligase [Thermodesulfobacteriota bacterium]
MAMAKNEDVLSYDYAEIEKQFSWYETGKINMAHECIDRHAEGVSKDKVALNFVGDDSSQKLTFADLKNQSNKFGNVLKKYGMKKGDRIFTFFPRSPEVYVSILGILKIGAIVGPLFEAFMLGAVKDRLEDSEAVAIVTTPAMLDRIPKKDLPNLKYIILVNANEADYSGDEYIFYEKEMAEASDALDIEWVDREDPMILHYTSGSTGKPKGIVHVHNAMISHYMTAKKVLGLSSDDVYWCTADPGWVTGTSYGIFGPWLTGTTNVIRGGRFGADKWYKTIQDEKITVWYSAPTAFRLLMSKGDALVKEYDLSCLRRIYSVGEPLNPEVVKWGESVFALTIMDTWWMTETGSMLIANSPDLEVRPGSMGKPLPGITASIIDDSGKELGPNEMGNLAIKKGWPSMMRKVWKNEPKFNEYFEFDPWYMSGDSAFIDEDGYFWFQGRVDDVIKTSGERVGPFEVESALVEHPAVAEAGVIGKPDAIRGQIIKAFISLREGYTASDELKDEIATHVKTHLAAHAVPREVEFKDKLPKTRSGKIMRRVLKAWDLGLPTGDLSGMDD